MPLPSLEQEALAAEYAALLPGLAALARSAVRELDPRDDLEFLRVRGSRHEIMAAPSESAMEKGRARERELLCFGFDVQGGKRVATGGG